MMKRFREKLKSADFGSKNDPFPHFVHKKCPLKCKTVTFTKILMPYIRYDVRKM